MDGYLGPCESAAKVHVDRFSRFCRLHQDIHLALLAVLEMQAKMACVCDYVTMLKFVIEF